MKFKITITSEMTTGHTFTDVIYCDEYDSAFIEDFTFGKAERRGFKTAEVDNYKVSIENIM